MFVWMIVIDFEMSFVQSADLVADVIVLCPFKKSEDSIYLWRIKHKIAFLVTDNKLYIYYFCDFHAKLMQYAEPELAATNSAVATSMYASGQTVGALTTAINMVGFILFGIGILQQKNFSPILAGLMIVTGIYTLVFCLVDYEGQLIGIGFLGIVASLVWLGASLLSKKS